MISLLWRDTAPRERLSHTTWEDDLTLTPLVQAISGGGRHASFTRSVLVGLCTDPQTITYRQDVLADLLRLPVLAARLEQLLPQFASLAQNSRWAEEGGVFQIAARLSELDLYVSAVQSLLALLDEQQTKLQATGWLNLYAHMRGISESAEFQSLVNELPGLRTQIERAGGVKLGINLDTQLRPESATLLGFTASRFSGPHTLLGRLFGGERESQSGVTPLRHADERQTFGPDRQLFRDLSHLLEEVTAPIAAILSRCVKIHCGEMATLERELAFYLGAARLIGELQRAGHALCRPTIAPQHERVCQIAGAYNLELALRLHRQPATSEAASVIVPNDVRFDGTGRVFVLTGPNRGGKTTFTRAIGLIQALSQAGLHVPGCTAWISPVDAIFTLFPAAERAQTGMGRLDEEAAQLATLFRQATPHSLVLLNEPLNSTSPAEALGIARDVLCGLRMLGVRAILVTHLHDLAHEAETLNTMVSGDSRIGSLVAGIAADSADSATRTYRILPSTPVNRSYAADIALQHGLHLDQIVNTLRERGYK
ncbi:MAG: hypothetical protein MI924_11690 [Chloroflexales bacterium]|nr:hypothetical protein [Chloroflexales bacterium]